MVWYPAARRHPLGVGAGKFLSGPFKIVWHTTEGDTMAGALSALGRAHSESHFVIDPHEIVQLLDTDQASRSLRNTSGGVETNRDSAIQIECVGWAGKAKNHDMMVLARELARWLENKYGIPAVWPAGYPPMNPAGPFRRDPHIWDTLGGHYGHSQVPENTHWDPGFTPSEITFLMSGSVPPSVLKPIAKPLDPIPAPVKPVVPAVQAPVKIIASEENWLQKLIRAIFG